MDRLVHVMAVVAGGGSGGGGRGRTVGGRGGRGGKGEQHGHPWANGAVSECTRTRTAVAVGAGSRSGAYLTAFHPYWELTTWPAVAPVRSGMLGPQMSTSSSPTCGAAAAANVVWCAGER